jgi:aldehyde oxidoreductase
VVRSEVPHALIKSIDSLGGPGHARVAGVMTSRISRAPTGSNMVVADRPVLCRTRCATSATPSLVVAAETKAEAEAAAKAVKVELEPLPVLDEPPGGHGRGRPRCTRTGPTCASSSPR